MSERRRHDETSCGNSGVALSAVGNRDNDAVKTATSAALGALPVLGLLPFPKRFPCLGFHLGLAFPGGCDEGH